MTADPERHHSPVRLSVAIATSNAQALDQDVVDCVSRVRSCSLELGGLLFRVKEIKAYRALGFKWFQDYVNARGLSISYAERVMRAHKAAVADPSLADLSVDQILFVQNVSTREGSGKTREEWAEFARNSSHDKRAAEKKRLTRAGILPSNATGREQAIKAAPIEASVDMTIRVSARARRLFEEQRRQWGLSAGGTLLKLILLAQEK